MIQNIRVVITTSAFEDLQQAGDGQTQWTFQEVWEMPSKIVPWRRDNAEFADRDVQ